MSGQAVDKSQEENVYETSPVRHPDENAVRSEFNGTVNQLTLSAVEGFDFSAAVGQLHHRVLVVFGEDDPASMEPVEETLSTPQSADVGVVLLEKCRNCWHKRLDQFYPPVRAFLRLAEDQE